MGQVEDQGELFIKDLICSDGRKLTGEQNDVISPLSSFQDEIGLLFYMR